MINVETVLLNALGQKGDPYIFGAEAAASDPDPDAFDCSELVEWSCARSGVTPKISDGAFNQWVQTKGKGGQVLSVADAIKTRGALLFVGDGTGSGRDAITHVAWSLGDGTTIEARGKKWGVGCWAAAGRFSFGGLLPGIDFNTSGHPPAPVMPASGSPLKDLQQLLGTATDGVWGPKTATAAGNQAIAWDKGPHGSSGPGNGNRALVTWLQHQGNRRFSNGMAEDGIVGPATNKLIVEQLGQADGVCGPKGYQAAVQ